MYYALSIRPLGLCNWFRNGYVSHAWPVKAMEIQFWDFSCKYWIRKAFTSDVKLRRCEIIVFPGAHLLSKGIPHLRVMLTEKNKAKRKRKVKFGGPLLSHRSQI